jgi:hypothetical protein
MSSGIGPWTAVDVIVNKADVLEEAEIPSCLLALCAHVAAYRAVAKKWALDDYSEHLSIIKFPTTDLYQYTNQAFQRLKANSTSC